MYVYMHMTDIYIYIYGTASFEPVKEVVRIPGGPRWVHKSILEITIIKKKQPFTVT